MGMPESELVWWPAKGWGFLPPSERFIYDEVYFDRFTRLETTLVGQALIRLRANLVQRAPQSESIVDVGVGGGGFVRYMQCRGFDVCQKAIDWLKSRDLWQDPRQSQPDAMCFWDSLEHMVAPEAMVECARKRVFISIPIFESGEHVISSKHYRPNEHLWYFTESGLIDWMKRRGFTLHERNRDEERYGREGIGSYWFERT